MTGYMYQLLAIVLYMVIMLVIGWYAYKRTTNLNDYMLGGRSFGPAVTALSAGAADMSGWLLMGLPGAIYLSGLVEAWIAIGLTLGCVFELASRCAKTSGVYSSVERLHHDSKFFGKSVER